LRFPVTDYDVRDKQFNPERRRIFNGHGLAGTLYTPALAARLIYLNRTGFNGLFRLNSQGQFNVPLGRYTNPQICDRENLERVRVALMKTRADICQAPFETVLDTAAPGDFVYFDPPYAPLSRTALFTSYTAGGLSPADQRRLQQVTIELAPRLFRAAQQLHRAGGRRPVRRHSRRRGRGPRGIQGPGEAGDQFTGSRAR
jgi:DNA adenine methylase Dam